MFDLFRSRAKVVRYLLGALLLLVAFSMVITLVPGFGGGGYAADNIIAEIGDETITVRDVQVNIQQQLQNNVFSKDMTGVYVPIVINQMIADRAVSYQAERMGFQVTDAGVALTVQSLLPQLFQDGQFVGAEAYAGFLSRMNLTIPEFESNIRKQMVLLKLTNIALEGEIVTEQDVETEFRRRNEKITLDYIGVSPSDFRSQVKATSDEMREYYEKNTSTFQVREKRDIQLLVVDQEEIAASTPVPESELRQVYQASMDRFRTPERVKARHILLTTTGKSGEEIEKIKAQADDLLGQVRGGADFAELAKQHSQDPGTAMNGGDLGWVARGQTVPNFENAAFSLELGDISDVVSTEYGFHIIQVHEKEQARLQPFEEVKKKLEDERKREFVYERMRELADQARAELAKEPSQAGQIGDKLGLKLISVEKFSTGDSIPEVGQSADLVDAVSALAARGVTPVMQVGDDKLAVATVTEVFPPRTSEFSEVEDQIRERLIGQKAMWLAQQKSQQLEQMAASAGDDLAKMARSLGLTVKSVPEFGRGGALGDLGSAASVQQAFDEPVGAIVGPMRVLDQTIVCKVVAKTPADMSKLAEEREAILFNLKAQKARQRKELLEDGIVIQLINEGKIKRNDRAIQRLITAYRS